MALGVSTSEDILATLKIFYEDQDMASQLVNHTQRRLRNCADRLARDVMGDDEDGEAVSPEETFEVWNRAATVSTPNEYSYGLLEAGRVGNTWAMRWFECDVEAAGS
jgi:hypothetical protein